MIKEQVVLVDRDSDNKRRVVLSFDLEQLLYDIKNGAYIEGLRIDIHSEDKADTHLVKDVGECGNIDYIRRVLDLAVSECTNALYPYTKVPLSERPSLYEYRDNELEDIDRYEICMDVPDTMSQTTLCYLEQLIHEYLVCMALWKWMYLVGGNADIWMERCQNAMSGIRSASSARVGRTRRGGSPF